MKEVEMDATTIWELDPADTTIEFAVTHMMLTTVRGRFRTFSGTIRVDERNPDKSRADVTIDAASIDTGVADRDAHLRSADFVDGDNHPKIAFRGCRGAAASLRKCATSASRAPWYDSSHRRGRCARVTISGEWTPS
jgi:hypothetical protein